MPVADTRTQVDARLEQRQLRESNALLVQQRDALLREISQWQPVLHAVRAEISAHRDISELASTLEGRLAGALLEKRDTLQREIDEKTAKSAYLEAQNSSKAHELASHEATIEIKTARVATLQAEERKYQALVLKVAQAHAHEVEKTQTDLPKVLEAVTRARKHLAELEFSERLLTETRQQEDLRLSTKSRDLAIYEDRIRQAAAKLTPPMQIHV